MKKRVFSLLCALCLVCLLAVSAMAADSYTYTITLSAGGKGTFSGSSTIEITGVSYDASGRINLTSYMNQVTVEDAKYYVKGFHASGQEDLVASVPMTSDAVYVVSYGIRGNTVGYTVNYQDADGNTLAPSEQFYGNVGDKPVVAFQYIEGYQPQAYNLTKTLSENEAENVLTFTYSAIVTETAAPTAAPTATPAVTAAPDDTGADNTAEQTEQAEVVTEQEQQVITEDEIVPDEDVPLAQPADIIDLDDESVPLAGGELLGGSEDDTTGLGVGAKVAMGSAGVLALGLLGLLVVKKKKIHT